MAERAPFLNAGLVYYGLNLFVELGQVDELCPQVGLFGEDLGEEVGLVVGGKGGQEEVGVVQTCFVRPKGQGIVELAHELVVVVVGCLFFGILLFKKNQIKSRGVHKKNV